MILAAIFGAVGGPLAYIAGEKLMAVTIINTSTIFILSLGWAIITPLLISFGEKK